MEVYKFVFNPIDANTYVITDRSGDCAVIDCGCYDQGEFGELNSFLLEKKLRPVLLLNTHCHLDHIFGDIYMLGAYNLRAFCHREDIPNRSYARTHAGFFGLIMEDPPEPQGYLSDGQIVSFGETELKVIHVPGHSAGSVAFHCEKEDVVFSGDTLFAGSIGRTDLPGGDFETIINSIRNRLFTLPGNTIVYPGHMEDSSIGMERDTNPFFTAN